MRRIHALRGVRATRHPIACPYGRTFTLGPLSLALSPSGYSPGSAQVSIDFGGHGVLYSGDWSPRPSPGAEAWRPEPCALWVMRYFAEQGAADPEDTARALVEWTLKAASECSAVIWWIDPLADAERALAWANRTALRVAAPAGLRRLLAPQHCTLVDTATARRTSDAPSLLLWPIGHPLPGSWSGAAAAPSAVLIAEERGAAEIPPGSEPFRFRAAARLADISAQAKLLRAEHICLAGPGDAEAAETLRGLGISAEALTAPTQPQLPWATATNSRPMRRSSTAIG